MLGLEIKTCMVPDPVLEVFMKRGIQILGLEIETCMVPDPVFEIIMNRVV